MKKHYYNSITKLIILLLVIVTIRMNGQAPGTMDFGTSIVILANGTNPSADQSQSTLLNNFDVSATSNGDIILALANSGNGAGTDAIGGASDAVLGWFGNGGAAVSSGTLSTDNGTEIRVTNLVFAYEQAIGSSFVDFTITGKRDGATVGTLDLISPPHNTAIAIDFTIPTTGSFLNIDELVITPNSPIFGGFSIDDKVVQLAVANNAPVIGGTVAGQIVNDNATISPFSGITVTDVDGDNVSATITLDDNAKGILAGTGIAGSGPYTLASTSTANLQSLLRALIYNPTDNRTATSETTTFTVVVNDGTDDATDNTTTVISNAVAPTITSVNVPTNATYTTGQILGFIVNFSENIFVSGTPQLSITIGSTLRQATFNNSSGSSALFQYTVQAGDLDTDGIAVGALSANGGTLQDSGGANANLTLNNVGNTSGVLVDAVAPTVTSIVRQDPTTSPTNADALTWDVTFNESVSNVDATDFSVSGTNATITGVTNPSGNTYRITTSGGDLANLNGTVTLSFAGGQNIADSAGNALTNTTPTGTNNNSFVLDNLAPTITSISRQNPNTSPTNADALTWDVTFNESVSNVDATDFSVSGTTATVTGLTNPSGNIYRVTISGGDLANFNGTVTLSFAGGQNIADNAGNVLTNTTPTGTNNNTFAVDNAAPLVTSIVRQNPTTSPTNADALTWDVTFNESVSNVDATDFSVSGTTATITGVTNPSGNTYRITASGGDLANLNGTVSLGFAGGQNIADSAGNALTNTTPSGTNNNTFVLDNTVPTITSILRQNPNTSPTNADALTWDVTFNESVSNVDATDFSVSGTTATITGVTNPSGNTYRVTTSGGDLANLNGTITLGFAGGQNINDSAGNALTNTTPTGTNNNTFVLDNTAPSITNVALPNNGTYTAGQNLDFNITFDKNVNVFTTGGTPQLSINIGGNTRQAVYVIGTGNSVIGFRYVVQTGDNDTDGITVGTLDFNGGSIADALGNNADPTLNNVGDTSSVLVDTEAPSGYSVVIDQSIINTTNESAVSFTFANAEVGANYSYSFSSSGGAGTVDGSGNIATATDQITGINLSTLNDGSITLSVTLQDAVGNTGSAATDTAIKDATAPSGYTVVIDQSVINSTNSSSVSFTFATAEIGTLYSYSFTSSGGAGSVNGSGTINTTTDQITGIDLSGLSDGTVTLSVTLEDNAGNRGLATTDTEIKDTAIPEVVSIVRSNPTSNFTNSDVLRWTITFSEEVTDIDLFDFLSPELGTYTVNVTQVNTTTYNVTFSGSDVVDFDGTVTLTFATDTGGDLDIFDTAGNRLVNSNPTGANENSFVLDNTAPTVAVTSSEPSPTDNANIIVAVTFSENVTVFELSDLTIVNGTASNLTGSGSSYSFILNPTAAGTVSVDINADVVTDVATNGNTAAAQFSIDYDPQLSIADELLSQGLRLYPNPNSGKLYISADISLSVETIEVFDITGKRIFTKNLDNFNPVNEVQLSTLNAGVYMIKITSDTATALKKLVIE